MPNWGKTEEVRVSRGLVVGIGKVKILRSTNFDYEIPMLSFLVIEEAENSYISSCIHLQIDGYGTKEHSAVANMITSISDFLKANFSMLSIDDAWYNLKDLSHIDQDTIELWDAYRDIQFDLAAKGIPTDSVENLKKKIDQLQDRINQLESENAQLMKAFMPPIVEYTPIRVVH